jgi:hypothetical protein
MDTPLVIKGRKQQIIEAREGVELPDLLRRLYSQEGLSQQAVADTLEVSRATVDRWFRIYKIPTRDRRVVTEADVA